MWKCKIGNKVCDKYNGIVCKANGMNVRFGAAGGFTSCPEGEENKKEKFDNSGPIRRMDDPRFKKLMKIFSREPVRLDSWKDEDYKYSCKNNETSGIKKNHSRRAPKMWTLAKDEPPPKNENVLMVIKYQKSNHSYENFHFIHYSDIEDKERDDLIKNKIPYVELVAWTIGKKLIENFEWREYYKDCI